MAEPCTPERNRWTRGLTRKLSDPKTEPVRARHVARTTLAQAVTPEHKPRGRELTKSLSDPKTEHKRRRVGVSTLSAGHHKPETAIPATRGQDLAFAASGKAETSSMENELLSLGVPPASCARLLPLVRRFGQARMHQILGLWTFLGDGGVARSVSTPSLQVWGPAGTGKTEVVMDFLNSLEIRHVRVNCACFASLGELQGRLAMEFRQLAMSVAADAVRLLGVFGNIAELPSDLQPPKELQKECHQIRSLDKLDKALSLALDYMSRVTRFLEHGEGGVGVQVPARIVLVLDHAQELVRFGDGALQLLSSLPEVLVEGNRLSLVMISRLPLSYLSLLPARDPPAVAFHPYTDAEVEEVLRRELPVRSRAVARAARDCQWRYCNAIVKFGVPSLGKSLHHLLRIGDELFATSGDAGNVTATDAGASKGIAELQCSIEEAVQSRLGLCNLKKLLAPGQKETEDPSIAVLMKNLTETDKRLLLAAYLGAHVDKDKDVQLFSAQGHRRRRGAGCKGNQEEEQGLPFHTWQPTSVMLPRLLAIYHRLARRPQLLGPQFLERLLGLRDAGLLHMGKESDMTAEKDLKISCSAELPLVRACAAELGVRLDEYLRDS